MNTADTPPPPYAFEQRIISLERGVRLIAVTILLLSSAPNLALAFSIQQYAETFPTLVRLPSLSPLVHLVFSHGVYFIILAVLWPLAGTVITLRARDPFRAMLASCIYLVVVTVQFTLTWLAFVAPIRAVMPSLLPR